MDIRQDCNLQTRIGYIDLLRAFGIIVMIMGHVGFGDLFDKWIHVFHMPMFFIISGYFYKSDWLVTRRIRTLLLPYLSIGILHLLISFIINKSMVYMHSTYYFGKTQLKTGYRLQVLYGF